jgi:peptidoglycan biosynthesis protein MviN/MurJ (putative lipid II flippase)
MEPTEEEPEDNLIPSIELATPVVAPIEANVETAMVAEENQPQIDMSPVDRPNQWSGLAIGVILGGVLTILILFAAVRSVRRRGLK